VPHLLPRIASEPPPEYVAFVRRHLESLRHDAADVVSDDHNADELYPAVLTDVAVRWGWLELLRTRLGRPAASETYLDRAFARRSQRWHSSQTQTTEANTQEHWPVEIQVWSDEVPKPAPAAPVRSSVALRIAPHVGRSARFEAGPVAEAAIAWWHAYETRRRRRVIAALGALFVLVIVITRASGERSAAAPSMVPGWPVPACTATANWLPKGSPSPISPITSPTRHPWCGAT
jgi:hypothetical protein